MAKLGLRLLLMGLSRMGVVGTVDSAAGQQMPWASLSNLLVGDDAPCPWREAHAAAAALEHTLACSKGGAAKSAAWYSLDSPKEI